VPLQASLPKVKVDAQPYRYDEKADFTGGLNLRADQFNIAPNESPAMLNVEVDPRGGVRRRDAVTKINGTVVDNGEIISLISHYEAGQNQVLAAVSDPATGDTHLQWNDDITGDFDGTVSYGGTDVLFDTTQPVYGVTFNDYTYIVNGAFLASTGHTTYAGVRWSGADASTALFTPDIDGSDGHFPNARYVATFAEFVWVAYTVESGTTHKNRVRWSKINDAENWTAADYIDIDIGEDGDHITAIIPDADRLLVFKENSVYAVYGSNADTFDVRNITRTAGCREGTQPVATTAGIFFWYAEDGVYLLRYDDVVWAFERIKPSMTYDVGQPALTLDTPPSMMWFDERLWVSVDYQSDDNLSGSNQNNRRNVFVWDPSLTETGAWVRHDINARSLLTYRPTGDTHHGVAVTSGITSAASFDRISKVDQNADVDDYGTGSADEIISYYQTSWFIGNRPTFPKRWGKTRTVLLADSNTVIYMYIYKDYDLSGYWASYYKTITGLGAAATWDSDPSGSGDGVWDTSEWQAEGLSDRYLFARWPTVGTAQAISLRLKVTPTPSYRGKWGVTSIIGMYRTRRLR
tara:strand:+ start:36 stop:1766 length:1731 start_codon:yes stop_codon:yes gene_type:complete